MAPLTAYRLRLSAPVLVSASLTPFEELAAAAGAGPDMLSYLEARSLNRTATLALVADAWAEVGASSGTATRSPAPPTRSPTQRRR